MAAIWEVSPRIPQEQGEKRRVMWYLTEGFLPQKILCVEISLTILQRSSEIGGSFDNCRQAGEHSTVLHTQVLTALLIATIDIIEYL